MLTADQLAQKILEIACLGFECMPEEQLAISKLLSPLIEEIEAWREVDNYYIEGHQSKHDADKLWEIAQAIRKRNEGT